MIVYDYATKRTHCPACASNDYNRSCSGLSKIQPLSEMEHRIDRLRKISALPKPWNESISTEYRNLFESLETAAIWRVKAYLQNTALSRKGSERLYALRLQFSSICTKCGARLAAGKNAIRFVPSGRIHCIFCECSEI